MIGDLSVAKGLNMPGGRNPFGRREFFAHHRDAFKTLCQRLQQGPLMFPASLMLVPHSDDPQNEPPIAVPRKPRITKRKASFQQSEVSPPNAPKSAKLPRMTSPLSGGDEDEWEVLPPPPLKPVSPGATAKGKKPPVEASPAPSTSSSKTTSDSKEIAMDVVTVMKEKTTPESPEDADVAVEDVTQGPSGVLSDEEFASVCTSAKDKNAPLVLKMATSVILPKLLKVTAKLSSHTQSHLIQFFKATGGLSAADAIVLPLLLQTKTSEAQLDVVSVFCAAIEPVHISHLLRGFSSKSSLSEMDVQILQLLCENAPSGDSNHHASALSMLSRANQAMATSPVVGRCLLTVTKVLGPHMEASSLQELRKVVKAHGSVMKGAVEVHLRKVTK